MWLRAESVEKILLDRQFDKSERKVSGASRTIANFHGYGSILFEVEAFETSDVNRVES
jgi:hypothetical protein